MAKAKKSKKADAPKKSKAPSKTAPAKKLHDAGLPVLESDDVATMEKRLATWRSASGWLVRVIRLNPFLESLGMVRLPRKNHLYWVPDSDLSDAVMMTKRVVLVKRCGIENLPDTTVVIAEAPSNGSN